MATPPLKLCGARGCRNYVQGGNYCPDHQRSAWQSSNRNPAHSATQRGYGAEWRAIRGQVLSRDKCVCAICGKPGANEVDHITPKASGGTDDLSNLRAVHKACHQHKSSSEGGTASRAG